MEFDRMLAELFQEEDRAREMATRLLQLAEESQATAAAERGSLLEFLRGPMEHHMAYEERLIFPQLEKHGLSEEVQVATKHHAAVRQAAEKLANAAPNEDVAPTIADTARLLLHHTNFEGDYIYPELTVEAWRELMRASTK